MTGLDYSPTAIDLSQNMYKAVTNLNFVQGDAEDLPFKNNTFDSVINVESSHCYGNMASFVKEVARVLKPGGYFSWVDLRGENMLSDLETAFQLPNLKLIREELITDNVVQALDQIHELKVDAIHKNVPKWIQPAFKDFAGVRDSKNYNAFKEGTAVYLAKVYHKISA